MELKDFGKFIANLTDERFAQFNDALDVVCSYVPEELADKSIKEIDALVYDEYYKRWPDGDVTHAGREIRTELAQH